MFHFAELFRHFRTMKTYFAVAATLFLAGMVIGFTSAGSIDAYLQAQMDSLRELAETLNQLEHASLGLFVFIFLNNAIKSIMIVFSGIVFGVLPVFFLGVNGALLGYLASLQETQEMLLLFAKGILPHGIIEIPAIIIASAYGLRFGALSIRAVAVMLFAGQRSGLRDDFRALFHISRPLAMFLILSLLLAALIESTLTLWLLRM